MPLTTGRAWGEGGMERPSRGVRLPLCERAPGMGGRSSGAGEDMAGGFEAGSRASGCARWCM